MKLGAAVSLDRIDAHIATIRRALDVNEARLVSLTRLEKACSARQCKARFHV